jgi:diaminopimelate epimerase
MNLTRTTVSVEKYHGTCNDFVVVDAADPVPDRQAFAAEHCDRETGVSRPDDAGTGSDPAPPSATGADGVLFLDLSARYTPPRIVTTLVKPDGTVAGTAGNGARCAAVWAAARTGGREFMLDTPAGSRLATVTGDPADRAEVTVEMGVPSLAPRDVPLARDAPLVEEPVGGLPVTAVDVGTPHAVAFVDDVDAVDLATVGPAVATDPVFARGASVTVAAPDGDGFRQRTYERGLDRETLSCGTGAVAVAAAARHLGHSRGGSVRVSPPGGDLRVELGPGEDATATLAGPVVHEFGTEVAVPAVPAGRGGHPGEDRTV